MLDVPNKCLLNIESVKGPIITIYELFRKIQTDAWFVLQPLTKMFPSQAPWLELNT